MSQVGGQGGGGFFERLWELSKKSLLSLVTFNLISKLGTLLSGLCKDGYCIVRMEVMSVLSGLVLCT